MYLTFPHPFILCHCWCVWSCGGCPVCCLSAPQPHPGDGLLDRLVWCVGRPPPCASCWWWERLIFVWLHLKLCDVSLLQGAFCFNNQLANVLLCLSDMVSTVREIVRRGMSINLYMFHGGSSFGFMSGALADPSYRALVPSYGQFLCVMSSITNKLVASWMQTDCERFNAELSTDQHYTEHPADGSKRWLICCITFFSRLWCSLIRSRGLHSKIPSPQRFAIKIQQWVKDEVNMTMHWVNIYIWAPSFVRPLPEGGDSVPEMPALHYREAYEPAIMYQHLSLWDALSFTEGVCPV